MCELGLMKKEILDGRTLKAGRDDYESHSAVLRKLRSCKGCQQFRIQVTSRHSPTCPCPTGDLVVDIKLA